MFKSLFLLSSFWVFQAAYADPACLDATRVNQEVFSRFEVVYQDPQVRFENCNTENLPRKFAQALLFIKDAPVEMAPEGLDLGILKNKPYQFFTDRIQKVIFDQKSGNVYCRQGTMAYVFRGEQQTMHICPYANNFDAFTISSVLLHEARHIDGFGHSLCEHGLMAQTRSCDPDYHDYKGSYGVGTEYAIKIALSTHTNAAVRQQARARAVVDLLERFNKLPLDMEAGALLQSQSGSLYFYNGKTSEFFWKLPEQGVFTLRSSVPTFFDYLAGTVTSYLFNNQWMDTSGEYAEKFRQELDGENRQNLLDVYYGPEFSCLLYKTKVVCGGDADSDIEITLNFTPIQFVTTTRSSLLVPGVLYILSKKGDLRALPTAWGSQNQYQDQDIQKRNNAQGLISAGAWQQDQEILVLRSGQVVFYSEKNKKLVQAPMVPNEAFKKVLSPYYWSRKLESF